MLSCLSFVDICDSFQNWEHRYLLSTENSTHGFPAGQRLLKANVNVRSSKSKRLKLRSRARLRLLSARRARLCLLAQNFEINKQGQFCERSPCSSFISSRIETRHALYCIGDHYFDNQNTMSSSDLKSSFPTSHDTAGYVGFANLPNQVRHRLIFFW